MAENQPGQYFESDLFYDSIQFFSPDDVFTYVYTWGPGDDDIAEGRVSPLSLSMSLYDEIGGRVLEVCAGSTSATIWEERLPDLHQVYAEHGYWSVEAILPPPPKLNLQVTPFKIALSISGASAGTQLTVQSIDSLSPSNPWTFLTNLFIASDGSVPIQSNSGAQQCKSLAPFQCFYRVISYLPEVDNPNPSGLVWVPPGTFSMGSTNEAEAGTDETRHTVTLTRGFYMSKFPVSQSEYFSVVGSNPSRHTGDTNLPVEMVSWDDATNFLATLNQREYAAGRVPYGWSYRLPTEAEWEYACRAGTTGPFWFGDALYGGMVNFDSHFEYDASSGSRNVSNPSSYVGATRPVGSYQANPWGLSDMNGNLWQWCMDTYSAYFLRGWPVFPVTDPIGWPWDTGTDRVIRGGAWNSRGADCRSAKRSSSSPTNRLDSIGFRYVFSPND